MKRSMTLMLAAALSAGIAATAWSQAGQDGADGAGGAGASGTAGADGAAGTPGAAGTTGTAGTAGTPGAGAVGTPGVGAPAGNNPLGQGNTGAPGTAGRANVGQNRASARAGLNNNNGFDNGISQTPFFSDPGARQQLNLNENQFNSLNRAYQDAYGRYNNNLRGLNSNLNEQQRMQQMQQFQNQFQTDFGKSLNSTLTDRQARTRYDQLNRQFMGFNAFNDPGIQQQLNLTPQQRQQLQRMARDWRRQLQTGGGNAGLTQEQWNQMSSQYWDQLNSFLTPQQRQSWSQATGERYSFSPNLYQQGNNNLGNGNTSGNVGVIRENADGARIVPHGGTQQGDQPQTGTAPQGNQSQPGAGTTTPQGNTANSGAGTGTTR